MQQKALDKGVCRQLQSLEPIAFLPMAVSQADLPISDIDNAVIGDGHAMRVAPDISRSS